ncbi:membrane protein insertion efficiency factor YidD [Nocardia amamiensis]|uniref:Putative membrane protein insertion efficiency factor n=1 Tax=Nocardia amamiensis TaxID=404578 RepID=A0ABS0CHF9_9NOCA|nr:membrane protein insertion efficiency factor YidD [Nocardia amamiensis]MBF6296044.1 membrane protein insertion efficiency factor YidD [Nocardia amamiensis]
MNMPAMITKLPANALIFLIELYRTYVSPTRMPVCRFTPTCSEYAVTALRTRGLFIGLVLTVVRLAKCAPWHPGGWDPVPERKRSTLRTDSVDEAAADVASQEPSVPAEPPSQPNACKGSPHAVIGDTNDGSA